MTTSKKIASLAAKGLAKKSTPKLQKRIDASDLAQSKKQKSTTRGKK